MDIFNMGNGRKYGGNSDIERFTDKYNNNTYSVIIVSVLLIGIIIFEIPETKEVLITLEILLGLLFTCYRIINQSTIINSGNIEYMKKYKSFTWN